MDFHKNVHTHASDDEDYEKMVGKHNKCFFKLLSVVIDISVVGYGTKCVGYGTKLHRLRHKNDFCLL
jgi:hypothetical protein